MWKRATLPALPAATIWLLAICTARSRPPRKNNVVAVTMHNVVYHFTGRIAVHIGALTGNLTPRNGYAFPVFEDARSFTLHIDSATISITTGALSNILNDHVFAASDAPLKKISIQTRGNTLKIKGKLHSKGDLPFQEEGTISLTPEGEIRVHSLKVTAAHVPVKGLMELLGVHLSDLINTNKVRGIRAQGDDLLLNPEEILPPPKIEGRLAAIELVGDTIIEHFGGKRLALPPGNYMTYRGGRLRFGKLTMDETDLQLIDMDARDPFDFYLKHYKDQLVAGYTKTTPAFGLRVFMPDYNKLNRR